MACSAGVRARAQSKLAAAAPLLASPIGVSASIPATLMTRARPARVFAVSMTRHCTLKFSIHDFAKAITNSCCFRSRKIASEPLPFVCLSLRVWLQ
jgi:hypothetical protein